MKNIYLYIIILICSFCSCADYLDVIPDNITTIDMAFNNRANARKYLSTCYNFLPLTYDVNTNASVMGAEDIFPNQKIFSPHWDFSVSWSFCRGGQNSNQPLFNLWSGANYFRGVHECNIFLANIDRVPDMTFAEKERWTAEVYTLKAYYLYWLFVHYGPIPLLKENVAIDSELTGMTQYREKVDDVVNYIVELLDHAIYMNYGLPEYISATSTEMGRLTLPAAMSIKAKVLVMAASPLFNGNTDYANFLDPRDNQPFFNQEKSIEKWERAAQACKEAIEVAEVGHHELFQFEEKVSFKLTSETKLHMTLREIVTSRYNSEQIFAPGATPERMQQFANPHMTSYHLGSWHTNHSGQYAPTLNVVEEYYTKNGVPLDEDNSTSLAEQYELVNTPSDRPAFFISNYRTIKLHLDREPRFYANIGFDGGRWFTMEDKAPSIETTSYNINSKKGGIAGLAEPYHTSGTGYFAKKVCSYKNQNTEATKINYAYPNTIIRLADIYLLYSEALNETKETPDDEVYEYIQRVRHRAGLDEGTTLKETWRLHSKNPSKPLTKEGMREIIHRERLIELQFEASRLHDLRRWKKCDKYFNTHVRALDITQTSPEYFYKPIVKYTRSFSLREYLWPLKQEDLNKNIKLVQNPLW